MLERWDWDVASRRTFFASDLAELTIEVGALQLLALHLFLARHADRRARVVLIPNAEA